MIEDIEMYIYWTTFANVHYDQRRLPVLDTVIWQIENKISHLRHQAWTLHSSTKTIVSFANSSRGLLSSTVLNVLKYFNLFRNPD